MQHVLRLLLALLLCSATAAGAQESSGTSSLTTLVYHDVVDKLSSGDPSDTVTLDVLSQELSWLQHNGYSFVSAEQVLQNRATGAALPEKPVLLTFDDGYRSFYSRVYPLLQTLNIPAVLAVVGGWHPADNVDTVLVDGVVTPANHFLTREQLREVGTSGLVEIASHTFDQHRSVLANALGSRIPAVIARVYDASSGHVESEESYEARLVTDLQRNAEFIRQLTGHAPRLLAWPYGRYNGAALRAAQKTGVLLTLTLDETGGSVDAASNALPRKYIQNNQTLKGFAVYATRKSDPFRPLRHVALSLDSLVQPDGQATSLEALIERRLSGMLNDLSHSQVTAVLLNPFGADCHAYFAKQDQPGLKDLLSRVVWQMRTRANLTVVLDLDVAGCLRLDEARSELLAVLGTASFDGLLMRTDGASAQLTEDLATVYRNEEPNKLLAGTFAIRGRTRVFQPLSTCRLPSTENLQRLGGPNSWVSLELDGCDVADAIRRLREAGVRHWGLEAPRKSQATFTVPPELMRSTKG